MGVAFSKCVLNEQQVILTFYSSSCFFPRKSSVRENLSVFDERTIGSENVMLCSSFYTFVVVSTWVGARMQNMYRQLLDRTSQHNEQDQCTQFPACQLRVWNSCMSQLFPQEAFYRWGVNCHPQRFKVILLTPYHYNLQQDSAWCRLCPFQRLWWVSQGLGDRSEIG